MKLVRYGRAGAEKPGLIDAEGKLRDLSRIVRDITPETLTPAGLQRLRAAKDSERSSSVPRSPACRSIGLSASRETSTSMPRCRTALCSQS